MELRTDIRYLQLKNDLAVMRCDTYMEKEGDCLFLGYVI